MLTDIEIAGSAKLEPIARIAGKLGLCEDDIECYGKYKAKIDYTKVMGESGRLILVTAITPTKTGEGKTTVTVGLGDALHRMGKSTCIALREPSLGPVFGMKGGAAGGGYSQVVPMEDINLHFTGDMHAITAANNLISAMLDNAIYQGNKLKIDTNKIFWTRCMDMNDRALREITVGLSDGPVRKDSFKISVASEIMAILCLATDFEDLRRRIDNIVVALDYEKKPVKVADLKATGAVLSLLKDAIKPNLVQTLEGTPAIVHGGPFANIAHGCNSVIATKTALKLADYVVTEAGFGADLGAEKFLDIKCRKSGLKPSCVVLVVTAKAYSKENMLTHAENLKHYGVNVVVAINKFGTDTEEQLNEILRDCRENGIPAEISTAYTDGGAGAEKVAEAVLANCRDTELRFAYEDTDPVTEKIEKVAKTVYRASAVEFSPKASNAIKRIVRWNREYALLPVCIAKTQYSLSDNPELGTTPKNFTLHVKDAYLSAGAGFIVVLTGDIMTMPGLPKAPAAEAIDVIDGNIVGLF